MKKSAKSEQCCSLLFQGLCVLSCEPDRGSQFNQYKSPNQLELDCSSITGGQGPQRDISVTSPPNHML